MQTEIIAFLKSKKELGDKTPTTIQQLANQVSKDYPGVTIATLIYNIGCEIQSLVRKGLVGIYNADSPNLSTVWLRFNTKPAVAS